MSQRNFRARDFKRGSDVETVSSTRDKKVSKSQPQPTSKPVAQNVDPEAVPAGTVPEVLTWVGADKERAQKALDAENADSKPRKGLLTELGNILDSRDGEEAGADEGEDLTVDESGQLNPADEVVEADKEESN